MLVGGDNPDMDNYTLVAHTSALAFRRVRSVTDLRSTTERMTQSCIRQGAGASGDTRRPGVGVLRTSSSQTEMPYASVKASFA